MQVLVLLLELIHGSLLNFGLILFRSKQIKLTIIQGRGCNEKIDENIREIALEQR